MKKLTLILSIILLTSCNMKIEPPKAEKIPFKHEIHGDVRIDNYYWLNERDNDKVIDYLNNENSYTDKILKHDDHVDFEYPHKGAILYLNTCDGYTYCEGEKVFSVANRLLLHDPSKLHYSTTTSNEQRRLICNVNYL